MTYTLTVHSIKTDTEIDVDVKHRSINLSIYQPINLSIYLSIYLSIDLPIYLSIYPSIHLSIYPSIYLHIYLYLLSPHHITPMVPYIDQELLFAASWRVILARFAGGEGGSSLGHPGRARTRCQGWAVLDGHFLVGGWVSTPFIADFPCLC